MTYTKAKIDYTQKTREILDFALDGTSLEEKEELPTVNALKRSIRNNKNKSNPGFFKEPISVARILTADVQRFVYHGAPILYYDSGVADPERFFVFTTDAFVQVLQRCTIIGVDATFKASFLCFGIHMFR